MRCRGNAARDQSRFKALDVWRASRIFNNAPWVNQCSVRHGCARNRRAGIGCFDYGGEPKHGASGNAMSSTQLLNSGIRLLNRLCLLLGDTVHHRNGTSLIKRISPEENTMFRIRGAATNTDFPPPILNSRPVAGSSAGIWLRTWSTVAYRTSEVVDVRAR